jgi:hypothetical protein
VIEQLEFASCYSYSPRGTSELAIQSRKLRDRIKAADVNAYRLAAERIRAFVDQGLFASFFGDDVTLIAVPGRAPLAPGAVSRTQQLCFALMDQRLARDAQPLLERTRPVPKSAYAAPGERPSAEDHFATIAVGRAIAAPGRILLVDDVVTRGATLRGAASRLRDSFPESEIRAFALVRTESHGELVSIRDPREGWIEAMRGGGTQRRP